MKKILLIALILTSMPVFAACSVEDETAACSIAQFQVPMQKTYSPNSTIKEFSGTPETRLKPAQNTADKGLNRSFGPQSTDYGYNSSCQFGVCRNTGVPQLFQMRNKNQ